MVEVAIKIFAGAGGEAEFLDEGVESVHVGVFNDSAGEGAVFVAGEADVEIGDAFAVGVEEDEGVMGNVTGGSPAFGLGNGGGGEEDLDLIGRKLDRAGFEDADMITTGGLDEIATGFGVAVVGVGFDG